MNDALERWRVALVWADKVHWEEGPGRFHDDATRRADGLEAEYLWLTEGFVGLVKFQQKKRGEN